MGAEEEAVSSDRPCSASAGCRTSTARRRSIPFVMLLLSKKNASRRSADPVRRGVRVRAGHEAARAVGADPQAPFDPSGRPGPGRCCCSGCRTTRRTPSIGAVFRCPGVPSETPAGIWRNRPADRRVVADLQACLGAVTAVVVGWSLLFVRAGGSPPAVPRAALARRGRPTAIALAEDVTAPTRRRSGSSLFGIERGTWKSGRWSYPKVGPRRPAVVRAVHAARAVRVVESARRHR